MEARCQRGTGEGGMAEYQVRPWPGWHHSRALSLLAGWCWITETPQGQSCTPALPLPHMRYGRSLLLLAVFDTLGVDAICRPVQPPCPRHECARLFRQRTRQSIPPRQ